MGRPGATDMKPVAIFRFSPGDEPGRFAEWLDANARPWKLIALHDGAPVPTDAGGFAGIGMMGGPMSVNDALPWIDPVLRLIRSAVADDVPVIGHCLGGQLMAKALDGVVTANPVKEIGWGDVNLSDSSAARRWCGSDLTRFTSFHWHGERFSIPRGAELILSSPHCAHQAFVLGKHIGMQCHVEMTAELIESWCRSGAEEIAGSTGPAVQTPSEIEHNLAERLAQLHAAADRIYARWMEGLA